MQNFSFIARRTCPSMTAKLLLELEDIKIFTIYAANLYIPLPPRFPKIFLSVSIISEKAT